MRSMNLPGLTVSVTMILLMVTIAFTFVSCEKQSPTTLSGAVTAVDELPVKLELHNFTALVKKEGLAVINISTNKKVHAGMPVQAFPGIATDDHFDEIFRRFAAHDELPREFRSLGSGFIISADGYILSNAHVIAEAEELTVRLTDQREFKAKLVGADPRTDIALLKISATGLPVVNLVDSSKIEVGEWVAAIGSPFGYTNTVSPGIVSAKGHSLPGENMVPFIQTDVPVNPGNSGGPLFNMKGVVVGIHSQIYSSSAARGLSFAIPIDLAMKVKEELLKQAMFKRGRLGVTTQNVSVENASSFGLKKSGGALINSVDKEGLADRTGLQIGDIILKFNGKDIAGTDDLAREIADLPAGVSAKLELWRNKTAKVLTLSQPQLSEPAARPAAPAQLGLTLRELTHDEQRSLHTEGLLLVETAAGVVADSGILPGDILIAINSQRVAGISQFQQELVKAGKHAAVLLQRDSSMIFVSLKFDKG